MSGDENRSDDAPWQQIVQRKKLVPAVAGKPLFSHLFSVLSCSLCSRQSSADDVKRYVEIEGKK
jgi:hypothetical protein